MVILTLNIGSETRDALDGIEKLEFYLTRARIEDLAAKNSWWLFLIQLRGSISVIKEMVLLNGGFN
ncbi:hypothetical protein QNH20_24410 [Neobacillus sp. WH10]|uniref:hypothetical protein n=1 Tax=Neobacillus sp. WH10 TaxID=3047873 RepID=UPI0024C0E9FE|nr:hypothetical protein [Neobacillus sp. WH10]WHY77183.1 hypothetical protein QNH20_24410 [Neobacillus sp. WH10]